MIPRIQVRIGVPVPESVPVTTEDPPGTGDGTENTGIRTGYRCGVPLYCPRCRRRLCDEVLFRSFFAEDVL